MKLFSKNLELFCLIYYGFFWKCFQNCNSIKNFLLLPNEKNHEKWKCRADFSLLFSNLKREGKIKSYIGAFVPIIHRYLRIHSWRHCLESLNFIFLSYALSICIILSFFTFHRSRFSFSSFLFFFGAMSHKILTNFSPKAVGKIFRHLSVRLHLINLKANSASQLWANFLLQFEFPLFFWKYDKNLVRRKLSAHCKVHLKCTSPCVFPFFFTQLNIYSHCWSFISVNWPSRKSFKLSGVFVLFFQKKI